MQALEAGASKVICIEPNPEMAECLRLTFALQIEQGRVVVRNVAVGAANGTASFAADHMSPFGGAIETSSAESTTVRVETIARISATLARLDFIKMDIEGAELQAVEGAMPVLRRDHPQLALTTYHHSFHFAGLETLLTAAGYRHIRPIGVTSRNGGKFRPVMLHTRI